MNMNLLPTQRFHLELIKEKHQEVILGEPKHTNRKFGAQKWKDVLSSSGRVFGDVRLESIGA